MDWTAMGAIGETVGAFAVVVSLAYLASQVRTQNREAATAAVHEILDAFRKSISAVQERDRAEVYARAISGFDELPDAQRIQFIAIIQGVLRVWEEAFFQHDAKRLDERIWRSMVTQWRDFLATDGAQKVWELRKHAYSDDFRKFVDSLEKGEYVISGRTLHQ